MFLSLKNKLGFYLSLSLILCSAIQAIGQVNVDSYTNSSTDETFSGCDSVVASSDASAVDISGTATVTFDSKGAVYLRTGFKAHDFTGGGYIKVGDFDMTIIADAGSDTSASSVGNVVIGGSPSALSGNSPYTYLWNNVDLLDDSTTANPSARIITSTAFVLEVTDNVGCVALDTVNVDLNLSLFLTAGEDTTICYGESIMIGSAFTANYEDTPFASFLWEPADAVSDTIASNPYTTIDTTTTIILTYTNASGISAKDTMVVTVRAAMTIDAGGIDTVCSGATINLGGSPTVTGGTSPYTYFWESTGDTVSNLSIANPTTTPLVSTLYTLTVTDANNCFASYGAVALIYPDIQISAGIDSTVLLGDSMRLGGNSTVIAGTSPFTYSWSPSTGLSSSTIANPMASPNATTEYVLTVTDSIDCDGSVTDTMTVTIDSMPYIDAGGIITMCLNDSVTLGGSPTVIGGTAPFTYSWTPTATLDEDDIANPKASPTDSTYYALAVTDDNSNTVYDTVYVHVNALPTVNAGNDTTVIENSIVVGGDTLLTVASGGAPPYLYTWVSSDSITANREVSFFILTDTTSFYLMVTDSSFCSAFDTVIVNFDNIYGSVDTLNNCTWTVIDSNSTNYTVGSGQKLCITKTGTATGDIILNSGGNIINSGDMSPSSFTYNAGDLYNNLVGVIDIDSSLDFKTDMVILNDGEFGIAGAVLVDTGSSVYNQGTMEIDGAIEVKTTDFTNYGVITQTDDNFTISDSGVVNNHGTLMGIDTLKNSNVLNQGPVGYVVASNMFNYSTGTIQRTYVDSIYLNLGNDTLPALIPDSLTAGSILVCAKTDNAGNILNFIDILDSSPPNDSVYFDVNTGTVDSTVTYAGGIVFDIDSLEICGTCPSLSIETSNCVDDEFQFTAVSIKAFDSYLFTLDGDTIQNGSDSTLSMPFIVAVGDSIIVTGTSSRGNCNSVTSDLYVSISSVTVSITGDTIAQADSVILVATGVVDTYKWTDVEDTLLSTDDTCIVWPTRTSVYYLEAVDSNGCVINTKFEVETTLSLSYTTVDPTASDPYSGEIGLTVTGGKLPFTYAWDSGGAPIPYKSLLGKGTYHVKVTDAEGDEVETDITLD